VRYFAYGSNMDGTRMRERGVTVHGAQRATLAGYKLVFNVSSGDDDGLGYANIIENGPDSIVEGVLYDIGELDIHKLDAAEDWPRCYVKRIVRVTAHEDGQTEAVTYVGSRTADGLAPSKEYLDHLIAGGAFLSPDYRRRLQMIRTLD
jgi:gamma-glutamylcyclotransferase